MADHVFLYDLAERVVKTLAAALLAYLALRLGVEPVDSDAGSMVTNTALSTLLLNLLTKQVGDKNTGSVLFDVHDDEDDEDPDLYRQGAVR